MIKSEIEELIRSAVRAAQESGAIPAVALPEVQVERPQRAEHGDYATSVPLRLASTARMPPLEIAGAIADAARSRAPASVETIDVAAPGFVNVHLSPSWLAAQVDVIRHAGPDFGNVDAGGGVGLQVEFVSANPVGPIHVGNGRGLALGDTLARVLSAANYEVQREYLVNDAGTQTATFAATLYARYQQLFGRDVDIPEGGYPGDYMLELAEELKRERGDSLLRAEGESYPEEVHDLGVQMVLDSIRADLELIGVRYDNWFSERSLYSGGTYEEAMTLLRKQGCLAEREGATWFVSSALGEEKDNVVVRSTGAPTYFASDIAYHYDKFVLRGFERVINVWGADHQGHVPRMKAAVSALGVDPDRLTIIIYQLVTLKRGNEVVRLSKRAGEIITLREVVEEVGADAARFNFVSRAADSHMDFDLELAKKQSAENPVYYVQYAHARIAGILLQAADKIADYSAGDISLLKHEAELALIRKMLRLPELVESMASTFEPHPLPYYAGELATAFHDFYERCRVLSDDEALSKARLKLVAAAKITLARALDLMGMTAPRAHVTVADLPPGSSGRPAADIAREAGRLACDVILPRFQAIDRGSPVTKTAKGRGNFVTDTDLAAEEAVLALLRREYPGHRFLSEETSESIKDWNSGWLWVIDPLDGTGNFARGIPTFAFNLALCHDGAPVLGLTLHPVTGDGFFAARGEGLFVNGARARVSRAPAMSDCLLGIGLGYDYDRAGMLLALLNDLWPGVVTIQNIGSAALGLAYAASARFDLYVHQYLLPWDMAAGILFVQEAGGEIITRDGEPVTIYSEGVIAGAPGPVREFLRYSAGRPWR